MPYDVIVVGAGPAGSITAHDCARAGLKTLLLEKSKHPREKPCGGAVMYRGLHILHGKLPASLVEQRITGLRFVLPSGGVAEFSSEKLIGITVFRERFDEFLAKRAVNAGAELRELTRVKYASAGPESATIRTADGEEIKSRYLVGADGVNSVVAKSLGLRPAKKNLNRVGLGMESDFHVGEEGVRSATNNKPSILEIIPVEGRVAYGWIFPKREHLCIGIAGAAVHMYPLRPAFDAFRKKMEERIGIPLKLEKRRVHFLGADGVSSRNVTDRAILVGDAAGFVDPMMGEGIAYAMKSGVYAADIIARAAESDRYDNHYLEQYHRLCKKEFEANFAMAEWAGLRGTTFAETVLKAAASYHLASDILAKLARGEIGYSTIPYTILKDLPRELPRFLKRQVLSRMNHSS
ncbi:MAG: NAD(P)/FAD-dependent oxidoreductase [Candidatus Thorarchaeota archaeon]